MNADKPKTTTEEPPKSVITLADIESTVDASVGMRKRIKAPYRALKQAALNTELNANFLLYKMNLYN
jgi:hypothetical protein